MQMILIYILQGVPEKIFLKEKGQSCPKGRFFSDNVLLVSQINLKKVSFNSCILQFMRIKLQFPLQKTKKENM